MSYLKKKHHWKQHTPENMQRHCFTWHIYPSANGRCRCEGSPKNDIYQLWEHQPKLPWSCADSVGLKVDDV